MSQHGLRGMPFSRHGSRAAMFAKLGELKNKAAHMAVDNPLPEERCSWTRSEETRASYSHPSTCCTTRHSFKNGNQTWGKFDMCDASQTSSSAEPSSIDRNEPIWPTYDVRIPAKHIGLTFTFAIYSDAIFLAWTMMESRVITAQRSLHDP
ncbi:hypothetical protein CONLIGDRAFT_650000 [Coniochaeta ligniaria NRRL 30616]|uniref:Uncharacterized protein n=1 Tax=Coniochaeta ligniaria NRRL 30616 TaxID=1408157 RepID=A0A1J7I759_9PEZI|nr:hypothetical protein CONLIGDRAFT_650000 [Coniochaeta ligniaria NRRL 30616]